MAEIIQAARSDEEDLRPKTSRKRCKGPKKRKVVEVPDSDDNDEVFAASSGGDSDESSDDSDTMEITNEEVCSSLTSTGFCLYLLCYSSQIPYPRKQSR